MINQKTAVTLGSFDGLHKGHMKVIACAFEMQQKHGLLPLVLLFDRHPMLSVAGKAPDTVLQPVLRDEIIAKTGAGKSTVSEHLPTTTKDSPALKEIDALEITAEVVTITSDSVETLHTVTMTMPEPADWSLNMVRSFFRRRLLPFYFREKNVTYKAIVKVLTDESMIKRVKVAFPYANKPQDAWTQEDFQMSAIARGLYSFPLPNTKSLGELRVWLMNHETDETATLQE